MGCTVPYIEYYNHQKKIGQAGKHRQGLLSGKKKKIRLLLKRVRNQEGENSTFSFDIFKIYLSVLIK